MKTEQLELFPEKEKIKIHGTYKGWWPLLDELPENWVIDNRTGSPLCGYCFITNGKSILEGRKQALLRVNKDIPLEFTQIRTSKYVEPEIKQVQVIDANYVKTVNELARKKFEEKLLNDIRVDLLVCEIEGWNKLDYIKELQNLICEIGKK